MGRFPLRLPLIFPRGMPGFAPSSAPSPVASDEVESALSTLLGGKHAQTATLLATVSTEDLPAEADFDSALFAAASDEVDVDSLGFWLDPLGKLLRPRTPHPPSRGTKMPRSRKACHDGAPLISPTARRHVQFPQGRPG